MKILQVNYLDRRGGAALIAWALHQAYVGVVESSRFLVGKKTSDDPHIEEIPHRSALPAMSRRLLHLAETKENAWNRKLLKAIRASAEPQRHFHRIIGREEFQFPGFAHWLNQQVEKPDIIHLHNLHHNYFDLRILPWLCRHYPVLMTLHDPWLLTGHCAHPINCKRWRTGCGKCPDLERYPAVRRDATDKNWKVKRNIYRRSKVFVAAPSKWILDQLELSILRSAIEEARVIHNGIDLNVFHPADPVKQRKKFGIPLEATVLLFVASYLRVSPYKDVDTLRKAVERIAYQNPKQQIIFLALGGEAPVESLRNYEIRYMPHVQTVEEVASLYQTADVYIHAAKVDNFPTTVLEALACGTPVVATAVGGIPEQVIDGKNGYLTPPGDPSAMAEKVSALINNPELRRELGKRAIMSVQDHFDLNHMVKNYLTFYQDMIHDWKQRNG